MTCSLSGFIPSRGVNLNRILHHHLFWQFLLDALGCETARVLSGFWTLRAFRPYLVFGLSEHSDRNLLVLELLSDLFMIFRTSSISIFDLFSCKNTVERGGPLSGKPKSKCL